MVSIGFLGFLILAFIVPFIIIFLFGTIKRYTNSLIPLNWPILGMVPSIIYHRRHILDRLTEIQEANRCSFFFKCVWFSNNDMFITADPANVQYIMNTNFDNYPKGPDFKYIFDILGDGIFNSDSDLWKSQRVTAQHLINHPRFLQFMAKVTKQKVEEGIIPVLDSVCKNNSSIIDLQDLFQRFSLDNTCMVVCGFDPLSLSVDFPENQFGKAIADVEEMVFLRHFFPKTLWELQKKLNFGHAKRFKQWWETIDETLEKWIAIKKDNSHKLLQDDDEEVDGGGVDLFSSYMNKNYDDKFLRDTLVTFIVAGRDTISSALSWFFYCVSNNPTVETKIREELKSIIPPNENQEQKRVFSAQELEKLLYLHGAICETLRLYPSIPFNHKVPIKPDILPSGHRVNSKTKIILNIYSLGRMKSIWGKDCMEFKPERWITENGMIKHVPPHKFFSFNAGPRICLGKGLTFTLMKIVAAAIIHNYNIQQIGHNVTPGLSVILHMKYGFKVKIASQWS